MPKSPRIRWKGTVNSRGLVDEVLSHPGDLVLVRGNDQNRWIVIRCPCGCGADVPLNLDPRSGPAWRIYNPGPTLTLFPSVWRESDCELHFVVRRGDIVLVPAPFGEDPETIRVDNEVLRSVAANLRTSPRHYVELAESIGADPWDVLDACNALVRDGLARENMSQPESGWFEQAYSVPRARR